MNKGKFASLILLGAFSAGVASSSAVSAHGNENLASVVDNKGASSHDDSVSIDPKVSKEPVVAFDETKIDTETTTDEETQDDSKDEDNNASADTENSDKNIENKTDLPESSAKENSKDEDYVFVDDDKKQNVKKVRMVKGLTIAGIGTSAVSGATFGISKLVKTSGNDKNNKPSTDSAADPNPEPNNSKDPDDDSVKNDVPTSDPSTDSTADPSPEPNNSKDQDDDSVKKNKSTSDPSTDSTADPNPESDKPTDPKKKEKELEEKEEKDPEEKFKEEEKGGFVEWYKNNLGVSIPLTIYISWIIVRMIYLEVRQQKGMRKEKAKGIYFDFDFGDGITYEGCDDNIKPLGGLWKSFTKKGRFTAGGDHIFFSITYKGLDRLKVNLVAAATFAKYSWKYAG